MHPLNKKVSEKSSVDVSDNFYFFFLGRGAGKGGGAQAGGEWGSDGRGGGWVLSEERQGGRGGTGGGGGRQIFFSGPKFLPGKKHMYFLPPPKMPHLPQRKVYVPHFLCLSSWERTQKHFVAKKGGPT